MINTLAIPKTEPIEPHIDTDGSFICQRCHAKLKMTNYKCPKCDQMINWSWIKEEK